MSISSKANRPPLSFALTGASKAKQENHVIRRKSAIGDVKLIDPKAQRKDSLPEATAERNKDPVIEKLTGVSGGANERLVELAIAEAAGKDSEALIDVSTVPQYYESDALLALAAANSGLPHQLVQGSILKEDLSESNSQQQHLRVDTLGKEPLVSKGDGMHRGSKEKVGDTSSHRKEAELPVSTGLGVYFEETEEQGAFSGLSEGQALGGFLGNDRERTTGSSAKFGVDTSEAFGMPRMARGWEGKATVAERARIANEETWALIRAIYEWVVITFL